MSDLKSRIEHMVDELKGLETRARGLKNQNLADIAATAHRKVKQLTEHADLELVDEKKEPAADFHGTDDQFTTGPGANSELAAASAAAATR
jgi:hypothetical protein